MKKWIIGLALFLTILIPLTVWGFHLIVTTGGVPAAGDLITEDFSGNLDAWDLETANWAIAGGELTINSAESDETIRHITNIGSQNYWIVAKLIRTEPGDYVGVALRLHATWDTGSDYWARVLNEGTTWDLDICEGPDRLENNLDTDATGVTSGNYYGFEVSGSGATFQVDIWDLGNTDPGGAPGSWGVADITLAGDPDNEPAGTYMGLHGFETTGGSIKYDDVRGDAS